MRLPPGRLTVSVQAHCAPQLLEYAKSIIDASPTKGSRGDGPRPSGGRRLLEVVLVLATLNALAGCCTTSQCLDRKSTPDRSRIKAEEVKLGVVHNDRVSSPDRDRTDWKFIDLPRKARSPLTSTGIMAALTSSSVSTTSLGY